MQLSTTQKWSFAGSGVVLLAVGAALGWAVGRHRLDVHVDVTRRSWLIGGAVVLVLALWVCRYRAPVLLGEIATVALGVALLGASLLALDVILSLWTAVHEPVHTAGAAGTSTPTMIRDLGLRGTGIHFRRFDVATLQILMFMVTGALGGLVTGLRAFTAKTGNATFRDRWTWWYLACPLFGATAGFALSAAVVRGIVQVGTGPTDGNIDVSFLIFVAFVSGLFSKAVLDSLAKFLPQPRVEHGPSGLKVTPKAISASAAGEQVFEISGTGLTSDTKVLMGSTELPTTFHEGTITARATTKADEPVVLEVVNEQRASAAVIVARTG